MTGSRDGGWRGRGRGLGRRRRRGRRDSVGTGCGGAVRRAASATACGGWRHRGRRRGDRGRLGGVAWPGDGDGVAVGAAVGAGVFAGATWGAVDPGCVPVTAGPSGRAGAGSVSSPSAVPERRMPTGRYAAVHAGSSGSRTSTDSQFVVRAVAAPMPGTSNATDSPGFRASARGAASSTTGAAFAGSTEVAVTVTVVRASWTSSSLRDGGGPVRHGRDRLPAGVRDPDGHAGAVGRRLDGDADRAVAPDADVRLRDRDPVGAWEGGALDVDHRDPEPVAAGLARRRQGQVDRVGLGAGAPRLHGHRLGLACARARIDDLRVEDDRHPRGPELEAGGDGAAGPPELDGRPLAAVEPVTDRGGGEPDRPAAQASRAGSSWRSGSRARPRCRTRTSSAAWRAASAARSTIGRPGSGTPPS